MKEIKDIDLDTKMMVIKQYEGGKKINVIGCEVTTFYCVNNFER